MLDSASGRDLPLNSQGKPWLHLTVIQLEGLNLVCIFALGNLRKERSWQSRQWSTFPKCFTADALKVMTSPLKLLDLNGILVLSHRGKKKSNGNGALLHSVV